MQKETYLLRLAPKKKAALQKKAARLGLSFAAYLDRLTEFDLEIETKLKIPNDGQEKNPKVD